MIKIGLFYFSSSNSVNTIQTLINQAKIAEELGYSFLMYPERHFDHFGAFFNNPLTVGAIIGTHTSKIKIRTGSLIPALHHPIRLLEQIRIIDQCCRGRLELCLGSGWHPNDFILNPNVYYERKEFLTEFICNFDDWYRMGVIKARNGVNSEVELKVFPDSTNQKIPLWLTISSSIEAWKYAGEKGLNVFTHMENVDHATLKERIMVYKNARKEANNEYKGTITLMQHTLVTDRLNGTEDMLLMEYLSRGVELEKKSIHQTKTMSGNKRVDIEMMDATTTKEMLGRAVKKYISRTSLICNSNEIYNRLYSLESIGIDEVACLIDFHDEIEYQNSTIEELSKVLSKINSNGDFKEGVIDDFCK